MNLKKKSNLKRLFVILVLSYVFYTALDLCVKNTILKSNNVVKVAVTIGPTNKVDPNNIIEDKNKIIDFHTRDLAANFSQQIQDRFYKSQNPVDCKNQKYVICGFSLCGFGCQMHQLMYCFNEAFKQNRTLLLDDTKWTYMQNGFDNYFQPFSITCRNVSRNGSVIWKGDKDPSDLKKIYLKHMFTRRNRPNYPTYYVSDEDRALIRQFHSYPFLWWAGQSLKFLMRWQDVFKQRLVDSKEALHMQKPVVGIHIRRTDKGAEADFYPIERYLQEADKFFEIHQNLNPQTAFNKTIYVATDDPNVITELITNYTGYKFKFNREGSTKAQENRETQDSLEGVLKDIFILADCDYVVCTLSSNICRLLYELIQMRQHDDATWRLTSLDSDYFFDYSSPQYETAIYNHITADVNELNIRVGDVVRIHFYVPAHLTSPRVRKFLFNGMKNATNLRTKKSGLYPAYKTIE